ncbi:hypothetical protein [Silvibacterium dinghuense]|uniref:Zinc-finger domain-containing protein n=1 Tax=Silvibacterium dinghuense TaxID=1560006 RepID=A0A4Q1SHD0_9BACT|nr:hypothetical protein [Silvibacterium dinghuense]RXS96580.1 hypothetical protein ESZ00_01105 [Silvibacterium dinghuense]GGG91977.1 hypothetical protein GCM10011586_03260 [Silvibacterium dinghuense]
MDLLADETGHEPALAEARNHVQQCPECAGELAELAATMAALDAWEAPEPSPYFHARMSALLREERAAAPAGFFERLKTRLLFGSNVQLRPVAVGALALLLLIGGGTYAGLMSTTPAPAHTSATIQDLQSLDENQAVFQQLNALDQQDTEIDNAPAANNSL